MKHQYDLISTGIEINAVIKNIRDFYPDLEKFNVIKRLIAISERWDRLFIIATTEGGN